MDKAICRKYIKNKHSSLNDKLLKEADKKILEYISMYLQNTSYSNIALYWPYKIEPDITPLFSTLWNKNKNIFLPVVKSNYIVYFPVNSYAECGHETEANTFFDLKKIDIFLIPCLGINQNLYRLGWGKGNFDRTLPLISPHSKIIAITYDWFTRMNFQEQPHDFLMPILITDDCIVY